VAGKLIGAGPGVGASVRSALRPRRLPQHADLPRRNARATHPWAA